MTEVESISSVSPVFDDGKAPDALRTIGEVTRALGIKQHVLRYWEEQFPMLSPVKRSGGRRYYRPEDIALIARIDRLVHHEGFTLRGAKQFLEAGAPVRPEPPRSTRPLREELQSIRNELADALAQA